MAQYSFRLYEREVEPRYKNMMDKAESTEDVRMFFERTAEKVLVMSIGDMVDVREGDVLFDPLFKDGYRLSTRLERDPWFAILNQVSDLKQIMSGIADRAVRRHRYLKSKHPDKTEPQINPTTGPRRYRV